MRLGELDRATQIFLYLTVHDMSVSLLLTLSPQNVTQRPRLCRKAVKMGWQQSLIEFLNLAL